MKDSFGKAHPWDPDSCGRRFLTCGACRPCTCTSVPQEPYQIYKVCNSYLYVVDEVLQPAEHLDDVKKVAVPDLGAIFGGGGSASASPSPSPVPSPVPASPAPDKGPAAAVPAPTDVPAPTVASPSPSPSPSPALKPCDTTLAAAASASGLSILSTVLGQEAIARLLPDPAGAYTLFAPSDAAFFSLLSTFSEAGGWRGPGAMSSGRSLEVPASPPSADWLGRTSTYRHDHCHRRL